MRCKEEISIWYTILGKIHCSIDHIIHIHNILTISAIRTTSDYIFVIIVNCLEPTNMTGLFLGKIIYNIKSCIWPQSTCWHEKLFNGLFQWNDRSCWSWLHGAVFRLLRISTGWTWTSYSTGTGEIGGTNEEL